MKVLIFRSSFYAHIEEVVRYVLDNKWVKPDIVVHKGDVEKYKKIEGINKVFEFKGGHTFNIKNIDDEMMVNLKEQNYDIILIPCRSEKPFGYLNVYKIAQKISSPNSKIFFINPKLELIENDFAFYLKEKIFIFFSRLIKLRHKLCSLLPRKKKMLVICVGYLGDTVSAMRAINKLSEISGEEIYLMIREEYSYFRKFANDNVKLLFWRKNLLKNIFLLAYVNLFLRFKYVCPLFVNGKNIFVSLLASGAKNVAGYKNPDFYFPFDFVIKDIFEISAKSLIEYVFIPPAKLLGINNIPEEFPLFAENKKSGKSDILMVPESRWAYRVIFPNKLKIIADKIIGETKDDIFLYCREDYYYELKKEFGEEFAKKFKWQKFFTDLRSLIEYLEGFDIAIGVDTGITHLASALGVKVFCIVGPSDFSTLLPRNEAYHFYVENLPCRPCQQYVEMNCPRDYECIRKIDYDKVANKVLKYMRA